jgi:hypothetical protein
MDERGFEAGLERMFAQAPALTDADAFTRRVEGKLNRDWRWRTLGLGSAGVVGGVIAATQALHSGMGIKLQEASANSAKAADDLYNQAFTQAGALLQAGSGVSLFWMASGLLIIAAVVGATRALDQV